MAEYIKKSKTGPYTSWIRPLVLIKRTAIFHELVWFGLIGTLATLVHYLVALSLVEILSVNLYLSHLIGYLCAVSISYFGHAKITFQATLNYHNLKKFIIISVVTFLVSEMVLHQVQVHLEWVNAISLAIAIVIIPIISFLLNKVWVFKKE